MVRVRRVIAPGEHHDARPCEAGEVVHVAIGLVLRHAAAEPDHPLGAEVLEQHPLDLRTRAAGVAVGVQQALFGAQHRALAVDVDRAALEHDRRRVARAALHLEHLARDALVALPGGVQAPGAPAPRVEPPVDAAHRPVAPVTKLGPTSRIHESSLETSTTRIDGASIARQDSKPASEAPTVTGSLALIASATAANASRAGPAPRRQLSGRSGHSIQQPSWASNSPGMRSPSAAGVESIVALTSAAANATRPFAPSAPAAAPSTAARRPREQRGSRCRHPRRCSSSISSSSESIARCALGGPRLCELRDHLGDRHDPPRRVRLREAVRVERQRVARLQHRHRFLDRRVGEDPQQRAPAAELARPRRRSGRAARRGARRAPRATRRRCSSKRRCARIAVANRPSKSWSSIAWLTCASTREGLVSSRAYAAAVCRRKPVSAAASAPLPQTSPTISQQLSRSPNDVIEVAADLVRPRPSDGRSSPARGPGSPAASPASGCA